MKRRALLAAAGFAVVGSLAWSLLAPETLPPADPAPVPAELARFYPLEPGERYHADFDWLDGVDSVLLFREVGGWVALDGAPHAQVEHRRDYSRHAELYLAEWIRPGEGELLCSMRQVGQRRFRLEPPQPILRLPLEPDASWTWTGAVGEAPAEATFRVLDRRPDERWGEVLELEVRTRVAGLEGTQRVTYAAGLGLVTGEGVLPRGDLRAQETGFTIAPFPAEGE